MELRAAASGKLTCDRSAWKEATLAGFLGAVVFGPPRPLVLCCDRARSNSMDSADGVSEQQLMEQVQTMRSQEVMQEFFQVFLARQG